MPLHLLGKKSWNVYNPANIARVRRDEAEAAAHDAAVEKAAQDADSLKRMRILRGEEPLESLNEASSLVQESRLSPKPSRTYRTELGKDITYADVDRKRKRRHGEDDTDRDMRYAKQRMESEQSTESGKARKKESDGAYQNAPLVDMKGDIDLFPTLARAETELQVDKRGERRDKSKDGRFHDVSEQKERERARNGAYDGTMRFSDVQVQSRRFEGLDWSGNKPINEEDEETGRDVWGNEDPGRKRRDHARIANDDPLAAMMKGVQQVRKVEGERKKWRDERERELGTIKKEDEWRRRRRKEEHRRESRREKDDMKRHRRRDGRRDDVDGDVEAFSLDYNAKSRERSRQGRDEQRHRRRDNDGDDSRVRGERRTSDKHGHRHHSRRDHDRD